MTPSVPPGLHCTSSQWENDDKTKKALTPKLGIRNWLILKKGVYARTKHAKSHLDSIDERMESKKETNPN